MKYKKFIIEGYRGISDKTEINIFRESLIPIIGKNESGKTTCLEAILAFDYSNDTENSGRHLNNVENLYSTAEPPVSISAEIIPEESFDYEHILSEEIKIYKSKLEEVFPDENFVINEIDFSPDEDGYNEYRLDKWEFANAIQILDKEFGRTKSLIIKRDLKTKLYSIEKLKESFSEKTNDLICTEFVKALPYTLYFDDFRDRLSEKVFITSDEDSDNYSSWIKYIDEIFKRTKSEYSVFNLPNKSDGIRRSIVQEVQNELNRKLIEEWSNYQFDKKEDIVVKIEYQDNTGNQYLLFKIIEKINIDGNIEERFFDISDRSKGFYWYINFMIKLHYNPSKRGLDDKDTVYLLDEPGSYLHTYALTKLAEQLYNLSISNKVIYCTHSHNLLNPDFIPINAIRLAEKNNKGKIVLKPLDHKGIIRPKKNSAYQSVFDALEVKPPLLEFELDNIVLLEGIYDYYSFKMFTSNDLNYFPCVSASSIINQIPYMIFLSKKYIALWDDDQQGREGLSKASNLFGEQEAKKFMTLQSINTGKDTILERYFDSNEINTYTKTTALNKSGFCKFILDLYYEKDREKIISEYFPKTKVNFINMENILKAKLEIL